VSDLHGVTIAFDIDGTLFDPDGSSYRRTTRELLASVELGLDERSAWDAYESIRVLGRAMDRLALANANHFRAHPEALAALFLLYAHRSRLSRDSRISIHIRDVIRESLSKLSEALPDRGEADWRRRLASERTVRSLLKCDVGLGVFRDEVRRLAGLPFIKDWAVRYADIETRTPPHDPRPLLDALAARGAYLVVISEGLAEVQQAKLARLGLGEFFAGRALITQNGGNIPGLAELDRTLEPFLDDTGDDFDDSNRAEFTMLWRFRCVAYLWATKSPWFFGRCLHALCANPAAPASALRELAVAPRDAWQRDPMRFVMIGDRYDRDVAPWRELVGSQACLTIRLRAGRYADEFPETELPPDRRPSRTFTNWSELANYLTNELCRSEVPSIAAMPPIVDSSHLGPDLISVGHDSPHEALRLIACAIAPTLV
jgi:FMN phosphatase YigB (HAD superfamily)